MSPVSQAMKLGLPLNSSRPLELTEKPGVGVAPTSHWNWVVGAEIVSRVSIPVLYEK